MKCELCRYFYIDKVNILSLGRNITKERERIMNLFLYYFVRTYWTLFYTDQVQCLGDFDVYFYMKHISISQVYCDNNNRRIYSSMPFFNYFN